MSVLYPKLRLAQLPAMLGHAALGGLVAGGYGIIHDQITYSISHEYFTCLKFVQFRFADFGWSPRFFVAEIGFLASWWVGIIAAWFIARLTVPAFSRATALRHTLRGCALICVVAFLAATLGDRCAALHGGDYAAWSDLTTGLEVTDVPGFVRVAYIHNASYLGGLVGLAVALIYTLRVRKEALGKSVGTLVPSTGS